MMWLLTTGLLPAVIVVAAGARAFPAPPIAIRPDLFDTTLPSTLGLPGVNGDHQLLYRAQQGDHQFCHHPNIVHFKDRFLAIWSNGVVGEDERGQRILVTSSLDGAKWSKPTVLATDPTDRGACVAAGFLADDSTLRAFFTVTGGSNFHADTAIWAVSTSDGMSWTAPQRIASGFFIEPPRRIPGGRLLLCGEHVGEDRESGRMSLRYSDDPTGMTGWRRADIDPGDLKTFGYTEPNLIIQKDGDVVLLFRNYSGFLYASVAIDNGRRWSKPEKTSYPDSTARFATGQTADGLTWLISNPGSKKFDRSLLALTTSDDGETFDRGFVLRNQPTQMRFAGKSKLNGWQYPNAITHEDMLYVVYSINKEDVGLSRILVKALSVR